MARELLPDALWDEVRPLLPAHPAHPHGGHDFTDDRLCLRGLIFIMQSGIKYNMLPAEVFGVSGVTCWRRLRDWTAAGVWPAVHRKLLNHLGRLGRVDLSLAVIDSASVRAEKGGPTPGRAPSIAGKTAANAT